MCLKIQNCFKFKFEFFKQIEMTNEVFESSRNHDIRETTEVGYEMEVRAKQPLMCLHFLFNKNLSVITKKLRELSTKKW